jgi:hypothetical protein
MNKVSVAVLNASAELTDEEVRSAVAAVQVQVQRDFAPVWRVDAQLTFVGHGQTPSPGSCWMVILDNSDFGGALGYHDLTPEGLPLGKVFAATDKLNDVPWTATLSHEVLELLVDPYMSYVAAAANGSGYVLYPYEICDACQSRAFGYTINEQRVSDFLYPAWFGSTPNAGVPLRYDHVDCIRRPFGLLPGGYTMVFDVSFGTGWHMLTPSGVALDYSQRPRVGSRRERRRLGRNARVLSRIVAPDKLRARLQLGRASP